MNNIPFIDGVLDPCLQCSKNVGMQPNYWRIRRVKGHFCSEACCDKFKETHEIPKKAAPKCWQCEKECTPEACRVSWRGGGATSR